MIQINLLPEHLRPVQRTPLPYIVSFLLVAAALAGMASVFLSQRATLSSLRSELASETDALAKLEPIVNEANQLAQQKLDLRTKIETIEDILSDRIVWSAQLDRLAKLTPENVWYREIEVVWETFTDDVVEIDPKTNLPIKDPRTGQVKTKRTRVKKPVLQISGYVINDEEGRSEVYPLAEAIEADPEFSSQFTVQNPRLEDTEFNGYPVRGFTLPYLIREGGTG